jgi:rhamnosyltransferase
MKICSVTILFHPDDVVKLNVNSYLNEVDTAYIIDNTEGEATDNRNLFVSLTELHKIVFIKNKTNEGIGKSLNIAFEMAVDAGFDWMLTMDQDSGFKENGFFKLAESKFNDNNIAIIGASVHQQIPFTKQVDADFNSAVFLITSGNLVRISAWKKLGGYNEKLFIDEVDTDFCLRMQNNGFKILSTTTNFLQHKLGNQFEANIPFSKRVWPIGIHAPFRMYYMARNGLYMIKNYAFSHPKYALYRMKSFMAKFLFILFFYPKKAQYLNCFFSGVTDFMRSKYGKKPA